MEKHSKYNGFGGMMYSEVVTVACRNAVQTSPPYIDHPSASENKMSSLKITNSGVEA